MDGPAILAEGLVKRFGGVQALSGVDLEVGEGTILGLLGPNGAGKTTAIRILSTLLRPDAGRATVGGYDVVRQPQEVRSLIGLTGQYAAVDELLSGTENLYMIGRLLGIRPKPARARAAELLDTFDLTEAAGKAVKTYSGGMRRRLDLSASLVGKPKFLYLDEPTTGLDPVSRRQLWDLITGLVREGTTVLLTTQYLDEADHLADTIVVVDHGRVIAAGTPDQLKAKTGGQVVEVRLAHRVDGPVVAGILQDIAGQPAAFEEDGDLVTVPVPESSLAWAAARRLDEAQVMVDELALRRPSLDEVFLSLTGHHVEPEPEPTTDQKRRTR